MMIGYASSAATGTIRCITTTLTRRRSETLHQRGYKFFCLMRRAEESTITPTTRKLILTNSTLYNIWNIDSLKVPIHIEIESIVGARIRDLTRALFMLYLNHPERLEIARLTPDQKNLTSPSN